MKNFAALVFCNECPFICVSLCVGEWKAFLPAKAGINGLTWSGPWFVAIVLGSGCCWEYLLKLI